MNLAGWAICFAFAVYLGVSNVFAQGVATPPKKWRSFELLTTTAGVSQSLAQTINSVTKYPQAIIVFNDGAVDCVISLEGPAYTNNVTSGSQIMRIKPATGATGNGGVSFDGIPQIISGASITTDVTIRVFGGY